jgi:Uncharacterized alpha/beta hydrolase domain (DUF2235)
MTKNIILCMDGTSNQFATDHTNVLKLCYAMVKDPVRQLVYYHPGLGTAAPPGFISKTGAFFAKLAGLAFGYGIIRRSRAVCTRGRRSQHPPDVALLLPLDQQITGGEFGFGSRKCRRQSSDLCVPIQV